MDIMNTIGIGNKGRRTAGLPAVLILTLVMVIAGVAAGGAPAFAKSEGEVNEFTGQTDGHEAVLYDITTGLPTSEANDIVQSSEGFIWIGSYGGLIRYDGSNFNDYNSKGIANVISLFADSKQRLLIGTNDSGLVVMENDEFTYHSRKQGLQSSCVRTITEDAEGNIIFGTNRGLGYLDPEGRAHVISYKALDSEEISSLKNGADGKIYGLTYYGAVFVIENLKVTEYYSSEDLDRGSIYSIYPDPDSPEKLYLGTSGSQVIHGVLKKGMKGARVLDTGGLTEIYDIQKVNKHIWVTANNGIGYLDPMGKFGQLKDIPMSNSIRHMMIDQEGDLWFTSTHQGVMKVVRNRFTNISASADLDPMIINCTYKQGNDLYLATETGLMILDSNLRKKKNGLTSLLKGERIRSVYPDSEGKLWISSNGEHGLVCYDPKKDTWETITPDQGLASDRPRICLELSDGSLAVATADGVNILRDGKVVDTLDKEDGIENTWILSIAEGSHGELYMGTDGDGIYVLQDGEVSHIGFDEGLESEVIMRMKTDPADKNLIWIVTGNSIAYLKEGKITTVRQFPYSNNFDLIFNSDSQIWVLSGDGIYVVEREDMLANEEIRYSFYDSTCGLPCIATANSYSYRDENGMLYIAGTTGVASVNVNDHRSDNTKVKLTVPYITVNGEYIDTRNKKKVTIPSDCRRLVIHAFGMTYMLTDPQISHQLEGFDESASTVPRTEMKDLVYTNLSGGTYQFRMAQLDSVTAEPIQNYELTIVKRKAFYEHTWFLVALALAVIAGIFLAINFRYRRKTAALEAEKREQKQLLSEITQVFAKCIDSKDSYTKGHSSRVAYYSCQIAQRLGMSQEDVEELYNVAMLHDIGKISIPDNILNKPGKLTDEEFDVMRSHSQRGADILDEVTIDEELAIGARCHHERPDGRGYPQGLTEEEIPRFARIISVADTFDAMFSNRPYRKKMPLDKVAEEIRRNKGKQFSEDVADALLAMIEEGMFDRMDPSRGGRNADIIPEMREDGRWEMETADGELLGEEEDEAVEKPEGAADGKPLSEEPEAAAKESEAAVKESETAGAPEE